MLRGVRGLRNDRGLRPDPGLASVSPRAEQAANSRRRPAPSTRTATCSDRASAFPTRRSASTRPAMPARTSCGPCATFLGFERNVIVQATCHGADNRALVDALGTPGDRARGVATVKADVTDEELHALARRGRARRALQFRQAARGRPCRSSALMGIAERIEAFGWHIVIYFEAAELPFAVRLLRVAADDGRRRSHRSARRHEAPRRPGVRALRATA